MPYPSPMFGIRSTVAVSRLLKVEKKTQPEKKPETSQTLSKKPGNKLSNEKDKCISKAPPKHLTNKETIIPFNNPNKPLICGQSPSIFSWMFRKSISKQEIQREPDYIRPQTRKVKII